MWSITKKDFTQFFTSLTGYIAITLFVIVNGLYLFVLDTNLLDFGYATLDSFFELAPWILIFLVPAIAMRSMSEEYKSLNFELLITKPITPLQLIVAKYLAILLVMIIILIPTLVYVWVVHSYSVQNIIDGGGIMGSYIGLFFLAATFAAISLCCSAFTQNAILAFLISVFACVLFYYGFAALSKLPFISGTADYWVELIGIDYHYKSMSKGVIDTRDVVYFLSTIVLFLIIAVQQVHKRIQ